MGEELKHTEHMDHAQDTEQMHGLQHAHGHYHSPEHKKKLVNRISRIIGHLQKVKSMIEEDEDCADILVQLSAVDSAIRSAQKVIINEHISHCIIHAVEDHDTKSLEEFQKAIEKFL